MTADARQELIDIATADTATQAFGDHHRPIKGITFEINGLNYHQRRDKLELAGAEVVGAAGLEREAAAGAEAA